MEYDIIIIGGGAAGMSAAIYAGRGGMKTLIIEKLSCGGQMMKTYEIDNYPALIGNPTGEEISSLMEQHAKKYAIDFMRENVKEIQFGSTHTVKTRRNTYYAKSVIIASGAFPRKLGATGEDRLSGAGVSYCAACDGAFFKGKDGKWRLIRLPGLLIPVKNGRDQIEGFQIRTKNEKAKYLFLSSPGRQDGTSAKAYAHFADYYGNLGKENRAIVIEGPLKADLVNYFTGIPAFAVPGVSSTKHFEQILPQIKAQGIRRLDVAFDMDYKSNPYVEKALIRMKRMIIQAGFHCNQLVWDPEYKGLDDYLNAMNGMKGEK